MFFPCDIDDPLGALLAPENHCFKGTLEGRDVEEGWFYLMG